MILSPIWFYDAAVIYRKVGPRRYSIRKNAYSGEVRSDVGTSRLIEILRKARLRGWTAIELGLVERDALRISGPTAALIDTAIHYRMTTLPFQDLHLFQIEVCRALGPHKDRACFALLKYEMVKGSRSARTMGRRSSGNGGLHGVRGTWTAEDLEGGMRGIRVPTVLFWLLPTETRVFEGKWSPPKYSGLNVAPEDNIPPETKGFAYEGAIAAARDWPSYAHEDDPEHVVEVMRDMLEERGLLEGAWSGPVNCPTRRVGQ